jgi:putative membrane protein
MSGGENPYERFSSRELILRDHLAIDRTTLANERTLLAYIRTALAFLVVGASCLKLFDSHLAVAGGWVAVLISVALVMIGARRFRIAHHKISVIQIQSSSEEK